MNLLDNLFEIFQNDIWLVEKQEPWCSELLSCKFRNQKTQCVVHQESLGSMRLHMFASLFHARGNVLFSHFFHISMRSGSWNLCSGEGGQSLIIGVCECDTILWWQNSQPSMITLGTAGQVLITICTLHYQGVPGSSVKQQPAPPSQETVLIVRERTQERLYK